MTSGKTNFVVHGVPVPQPRPRARRIGRRAGIYTPDTVERKVNGKVIRVPNPIIEWRNLVANGAQQEVFNGFKLLPSPTALAMTMEFYFGWPKSRAQHLGMWHVGRPDGDNLAKAALDAIEGILFSNDGQVCDLRIIKKYTNMSPRLHVGLEELDRLEYRDGR